jgi:hypothetical protein
MTDNIQTDDPPSSYDTGWKKIVYKFLYKIIEFFFPELYTILDTNVAPEFLDHELQKIAPEGKIGRKLPDVLVKVLTRKGDEQWLICHIELQTQPDPDIAKRMYIYSYRIHSMIGTHPISIVFLADSNPNILPSEYVVTLFPGNVLSYKFLMVKTIDWLPSLEQLKQTDNVVAQILSVYLELQQEQIRLQGLGKKLRRNLGIKTNDRTISRAIQRQKLEFKEKVFSRLVQRNLDWKELHEVILFLDWLVVLPRDLARAYSVFLNQTLIEGEKTMAFISTPERVGKWKGRIENAQEYIIMLLDTKFGISSEEVQIIQQCENKPTLDRALKAFLSAENPDAVLSIFHEHKNKPGLS